MDGEILETLGTRRHHFHSPLPPSGIVHRVARTEHAKSFRPPPSKCPTVAIRIHPGSVKNGQNVSKTAKGNRLATTRQPTSEIHFHYPCEVGGSRSAPHCVSDRSPRSCRLS